MSHRGFNAPGDDHSTSPEFGGSQGLKSSSAARPGKDHGTIVDQITEAARLRSEMIAAMKRRLAGGGEDRPEELPLPPQAEEPEPQMEHAEAAAGRSPEMAAQGPDRANRTASRVGWAPRFAPVASRAPEYARGTDEREPRLSMVEGGEAARPDDYLFSADEDGGDGKSPRDPAWEKTWNDAQSMEHALVKFAEVLARDGRDRSEAPRRTARKRAKGAGVGRLFKVFTLSFLASTSLILVAYGWSTASGNFDEKVAPLVEGVVESVGTILLEAADGSDPRVPIGASASTGPEEGSSTADAKSSATLAPAPGKPMETARLKVADAQGESQNEINLSLEVVPADPARPVDVRLTGLPGDAVLTRGERQSDGSWLLKPGDERDLFLSLPSIQAGDVLLGVEAVERDSGELAAPPQEMRVRIKPSRVVVVEPAAESIAPAARRQNDSATVALAAPGDAGTELPAPPAFPTESKSGPAKQIASLDPVPDQPADQQDEASALATRTEAMIARGNSLLEEGDIASARSFYERAYRLGNERAARPLARTYDPLVLKSLGVKGLRADPEKALAWYAKARTAGEEEVAADIEALQTFLND